MKRQTRLEAGRLGSGLRGAWQRPYDPTETAPEATRALELEVERLLNVILAVLSDRRPGGEA